MTDHALRRLQVRRAAFDDPDASNNVLLGVDLTKEFARQGASHADVYELGFQTSARLKSYLVLAEQVRQCRTITEGLEFRMLELAPKLEDRNCDYSIIRMNSACVVIECFEKQDVLDALRLPRFGDSHVCSLKAGTMASTTTYMGLPPSTVTEVKCVYRGDPSCIFEINFEHPAWAISRTPIVYLQGRG